MGALIFVTASHWISPNHLALMASGATLVAPQICIYLHSLNVATRVSACQSA